MDGESTPDLSPDLSTEGVSSDPIFLALGGIVCLMMAPPRSASTCPFSARHRAYQNQKTPAVEDA